MDEELAKKAGAELAALHAKMEAEREPEPAAGPRNPSTAQIESLQPLLDAHAAAVAALQDAQAKAAELAADVQDAARAYATAVHHLRRALDVPAGAELIDGKWMRSIPGPGPRGTAQWVPVVSEDPAAVSDDRMRRSAEDNRP